MMIKTMVKTNTRSLFLRERLNVCQRALARLQGQRVSNPLEYLHHEYTEIYEKYMGETRKMKELIGKRHVTSPTGVVGKKLEVVLEYGDTGAVLLGPRGPLWTTSSEDSERQALLQVVSGIANFPANPRGGTV